MAADVGAGASPDPMRDVRAPITATALDRGMSVLLAVAAVGLGATSVAPILMQLPSLDPLWGPIGAGAVGIAVVLLAVATALKRPVHVAQAVLAVVFLVVLVGWPLAVPGALPVGVKPWPWWLCNIGTISAAMAFRPAIAVPYTVAVPVEYAVLRTLPSGGGTSVDRAILDAAYVLILGGAALILIVVLRNAAAAVDGAQATAVRRYAEAMHAHATELERVQVDAIVHDSVLTTLLAAARAQDVETRTLAATMATNALHHLASGSGGYRETPPVSIAVLRDRITASVSELAVPIDVRSHRIDGGTVPASVADAVTSATLQAAVNSVQHAGGPLVRRWVTVSGLDDVGVQVEFGDDGTGFDVAAMGMGRLGVRRSILERVTAVGGVARIVSAPGEGTRVMLRWVGSVLQRGAPR